MSTILTKGLPPYLKREIYALEKAEEVFTFLMEEHNRSEMHKAADAGVAPALAVSRLLLAKFGDDINNKRYKRFIGMAVSFLMKQENYEIVGQPTPIAGDPLFKSATRFTKRPGGVAKGDSFDILKRITSILSADELKILIQLCQSEMELRR